MTSNSSPLLAAPQNSQPNFSRWHAEIAEQQGAHNASRYDLLDPRSNGTTSRHSASTPSSTAYEPSHLESDCLKQNSTNEPVSIRASIGSWILEIIAIVVSAVAIFAIVALLHRENGRSLTDWKLAVSLNTVVAALGTLARTTLAFALSACIGQQKWNWLRRKPDGLVAWERFDEASRGPWGGTRLFVWLRARHWAALGALVTVGAIAFDPFLQAVISAQGQLDSVPANVDAMIGWSSRIDGGFIKQYIGAARAEMTSTGQFSYVTTISSRPDFGFISSVYNGFQFTSNFQKDAIGAECSTGNCTWPIYASAAVCSSCEDVTSHMKVQKIHDMNGTNIPTMENNHWVGDFIKYELPYANIRNYYGLLGGPEEVSSPIGTRMTANTTIDANRTIAFQHMETMLMAFTVMRASQDVINNRTKWEDSRPTATECALYLCANAYESKSENNIVTERILGSWAHKIPNSYGLNTSAWNYEPGAIGWVESLGSRLYEARIDRYDLQLAIPQDESEHLPVNISREFNVSHAFIFSAMDFLLDWTKGNNEQRNNLLDKDPPDEAWNMLGVPWTTTSQPAVVDALWNSMNLTTTFENVARSITNQIRNSSPDRLQGELQKWAVHVHVDWPYLAYPIFMLVAGIVYVILTIVESTRLHVPVWKESALPTLLHGFDDETQRLLRADKPATQHRVQVRFEQDEKDCLRLVAQH